VEGDAVDQSGNRFGPRPSSYATPSPYAFYATRDRLWSEKWSMGLPFDTMVQASDLSP